MNITKSIAEQILEESHKLNLGLWKEHFYNVAKSAKCIAEHCIDLNPYKAYIMGLLHDIGRREGITYMKHTLDGYIFLSNQGYDDIAKICLTHSFPIKTINCYNGKNDCSIQETEFINKKLTSITYTDYDRLIQLCDAISMPNGICCVEKRLVDVTIRHGFNEFTIAKWKSFLSLKNYFDNKIHKNIYELFELVY